MARTADRRAQHQGDPDPGRPRLSTGPARPRSPPASAFSTTCWKASPATAASTSTWKPRATCTSTCTTRSRTPASSSARRSGRPWRRLQGHPPLRPRLHPHGRDPDPLRASTCPTGPICLEGGVQPAQGRRDGHRAVQGIPPRLRHERRRLRAPGDPLRRKLPPHRRKRLQGAGQGSARRRRDRSGAADVVPSTKGVL